MSSDQNQPSEDKVKGNGTEADANTNPPPPSIPPAPATRPVCYTPDPANANGTSHRHSEGISAERGLGGLLIIVFTGIVAACTIIDGFIVYCQLGSMNNQLMAMRDQNTEMGKQSTQMAKQSGLMASQLCAMGKQNDVLIDQTKEMIEQTKQAKVSADAATTAATAAKAAVGLAGEANATAQSAADAAGRAAAAAENSNVISGNTAVKQLRAYLTVKKTEAIDTGPNEVRATIHVNNSGSTLAREVRIFTTSFIKPFPYTGDFTILVDRNKLVSTTILGPGNEMQHEIHIPITKDERTLIQQGKSAMWVFGQVQYRDAFGKQHWTQYRFLEGGNVGRRSDRFGLYYATEGNEADEDEGDNRVPNPAVGERKQCAP